MTITDLLNEINYQSFLNNHKDYQLRRDYNGLAILEKTYTNNLCNLFSTYPFEKVYALIDYFRNHNYDLYLDLISTNNPLIIEIALLINKIDYTSPITIKNHLKDVLSHKFDELYNRNYNQFTRSRLMIGYETEYTILSHFLKKYDDNLIEEITDNSLLKFYNGLHNIDKVIFSKDNESSNRQFILYNLFNNPSLCSKLGVDKLTKIYNDILLNNKYLVSFDYNSIFCDCFGYQHVKYIPGMFRKCNGKFFIDISAGLYNRDEVKDKVWIANFLSDVVKTNKGDEIGLALFFKELNKYLTKSSKRYLKRFDFYNKYSNYNIDAVYSEAINKLIRGEEIDPIIRDTIGLSDVFLNKYDYFKDKFCKTDNDNIQRNLSIPLIVGLVEKERRKYGFDYKICLTNFNINNMTNGSFHKIDDILYINPFKVSAAPNIKKAFAATTQTIYHEVRHAGQIRIMTYDDSINYEKLLMAMDEAINRVWPNYYTHEYSRVSSEYDADLVGYNEAISFFKDYPEMQYYVTEAMNEERNYYKNSLSASFLRKDPYDTNSKKLYGIIELFLRSFNDYLYTINNSLGLDTVKKIFNEIPILKMFYTINKKDNRVEVKSKEYFDRLLDKYSKDKDENKRREAIYAIRMFRFITEVQSEIRHKEERDILSKYQSNREVFDDVRRVPRR